MAKGTKDPVVESLVEFAKTQGASGAKAISARDVVVDPRVRLKCMVPMCSAYGTSLMCPPNVPTIDEFREVLKRYHRAILVQVETPLDSSDKSSRPLSRELCESVEATDGSSRWKKRLLELVGRIEAEAFKRGFYLAAGFSGGECPLCNRCVLSDGRRECVHPFEVRPSMEAVGIDVVRTCERAGMPVRLSSKSKVRWTGLVLVD